MNNLTLTFLLSALPIGLLIFLYFVPVNLWITALFSGVRVGLFELVFMRIRKVPPPRHRRVTNHRHQSRPSGNHLRDRDPLPGRRPRSLGDPGADFCGQGEHPLVF